MAFFEGTLKSMSCWKLQHCGQCGPMAGDRVAAMKRAALKIFGDHSCALHRAHACTRTQDDLLYAQRCECLGTKQAGDGACNR
jgi:hypothetical protein